MDIPGRQEILPSCHLNIGKMKYAVWYWQVVFNQAVDVAGYPLSANLSMKQVLFLIGYAGWDGWLVWGRGDRGHDFIGISRIQLFGKA
jgi:hypothetical protein